MRLSELQHALPALSDVEKAALAETLSALPEAPRRASRHPGPARTRRGGTHA